MGETIKHGHLFKLGLYLSPAHFSPIQLYLSPAHFSPIHYMQSLSDLVLLEVPRQRVRGSWNTVAHHLEDSFKHCEQNMTCITGSLLLPLLCNTRLAAVDCRSRNQCCTNSFQFTHGERTGMILILVVQTTCGM